MRMRNSRPNTGGARYSRLPQDDDGFIDLQFERPPRKIPYKAIGLATILFLLGTALLTVGSLLLAGVYIDPQYADRTWPVLLLGLLVFIPGGYHVFIAYNAWRGVKGYSFDDIPDYND
ncbi:transmembrane protein 230-like [Branchiostoma floridae]|uniref:Transmembrane protein 230 n=1 Tax=Branchiostoma floridae TaxID=7739 RepID=A0A9J7KIT0_BRAFL|nr:transmembrane protein 230-like [Branchiostoma floridae]